MTFIFDVFIHGCSRYYFSLLFLRSFFAVYTYISRVIMKKHTRRLSINARSGVNHVSRAFTKASSLLTSTLSPASSFSSVERFELIRLHWGLILMQVIQRVLRSRPLHLRQSRVVQLDL